MEDMKLPWKVGGYYTLAGHGDATEYLTILDRDGNKVNAICTGYAGQRDPVAIAQAHFIVKVANCHDDLLKVVTEILSAIKAARKGKTVFWYHYEPKVRAAIAKAEPK